MKIRIGHSPDSDDAFMFWGLASGAVKTPYEFEHELRDIQTLNEWAMEGRLESTAVSVHALAYVTDKYALLRHGGSFGEGYGPMLVARGFVADSELAGTRVAIPGKMTSAFLALSLYWQERFGRAPQVEVVPFDQILPAVGSGSFAAGLIIHEGQLTYGREGFTLLADMGKWWNDSTGLPLPLGVNVVRKDLGPAAVREVDRCMRESIDQALSHRSEALEYALRFARGMDAATSDEFVGMYVNERTRDMGEDGLQAIRLFLARGAEIGLVPRVEVELAESLARHK